MIKTRAIASGSNKEFHHADSQFIPGEPVPIVTTEPALHGVFKSATRTTAGTTTITSPDPGGTVVLTDLIISTDKTNATSVVVRFTDDTETINVVVGDSVNAPVNLAIAFGGHWQGWKDARVEMVTTGTVSATVALGYMKIPSGIPFSEWDTLR